MLRSEFLHDVGSFGRLVEVEFVGVVLLVVVVVLILVVVVVVGLLRVS